MNEDISTSMLQFTEDAYIQRKKIKELGLLNGLSGIAIIYYLLAKQTGDKVFGERGLELLSEISEDSQSLNNTEFGNGLAGIGWSIEWLVQNEFINDINTDEILDGIDNELYKAVSYSKEDNISLYNGILGKIKYFLRRTLSCNPGTHRFKRIGHKECLLYLTDDLAERISIENILPVDHKQSSNDREQMANVNLIDLGIVLTSISSIDIDVNRKVVEQILYDSVKYSELLLSQHISFKNNCRDNYYDLLYLAISYLIAGKKHKHNYWQSQASNYITSLTSIYEDDCVLTTKQLFKKLSIYSLLYTHDQNVKNRIIVETLLEKISSLNISSSLFNGKGTIVLSELCLINPDLIKDWHEIFFI